MVDLESIIDRAREEESLKPDGFNGDPDGYDEAIVGITTEGGKGCYVSGMTPEGYMMYPVRTTLEKLLKDIDEWATANYLL